MVSSQMRTLVGSNANERAIQSLLKENLSILTGLYVPKAISNEYIVFSEFPLGTGKVDFVIFTNRSKMEVIFIEAKGADFTFSNLDGSLAKPINDASDQMRRRFSEIKSSYEGFRRNVHEIRARVEAGHNVYNSVLGENGFLHCDPNKEVLYRGVVIGGRTRDDRLESKIKRDLEENSHPQIKYESWDSWISNANIS